jgi:hypothetical protein
LPPQSDFNFFMLNKSRLSEVACRASEARACYQIKKLKEGMLDEELILCNKAELPFI